MNILHFVALCPLIIFLILSLVFYGKGLLHLITLGYAISLAVVAIWNGYEVLFWIPIAGTVIIALLLFIFSMLKGGWL